MASDAYPADPGAPAPVSAPLLRSLDVLLFALVLTLAFLVASTPVHNSDFWMHLAAGRLLAHGDYAFSADPFAYTPDDVWVNHSWLFDLVLYALYQTIGGTGLVVGKALLVAGVAAVLCRIRRPGTPLWLPACCTALALLAMSPHLVLQPACVSLLFLALTLWLLPWWNGRTTTVPAAESHRMWLLPPLFALWANCDSWFLLGPMTVGLFWLGDAMQALAAPSSNKHLPDRKSRRNLLAVFLVGIAACLVNPYHVRVFGLPAELLPTVLAAGFDGDTRYLGYFASAWGSGAFQDGALGLTPAGTSYYVLVAVSLASFFANREKLKFGRLFVWAAFTTLGAYELRLIPFFAVVAAPVTALNFQEVAVDYFARPGEQLAKWERALVVTRLLSVLAAAVLVVAAWTGRLQSKGADAHRVAWDVPVDPVLRRTAETLAGWRGEGRLADTEHVFAIDPEGAHYCAWFAPGVRSFLDHRFDRFPHVAGEYLAAVRALDPAVAVRFDPAAQLPDADIWRQVFERHGVAVVVLRDRDTQRVLPVLTRLWDDPAQWTLLYLDGATAVFAWNRAGSGQPPSFADLRYDPNELVFGQPRPEHALAQPPAPGAAPDYLEKPRAAGTLRAAPAPDADSALVHLERFQDGNIRDFVLPQTLSRFAFLAQVASPPTPENAATASYLYTQALYRWEVDRGPAAVAFLAVRAARRAIADDPSAAAAYLHLGQAYLALRNETRETLWCEGMPLLRLLRHVQAACALEQAVRLDADLLDAHDALAGLYTKNFVLDAALDHRREVARLIPKQRPGRWETTPEFVGRMMALDPQVDQSQQEVERLQQDLRRQTRGGEFEPLAHARRGLKLGLTQKALDVLQSAPAATSAVQRARLECELLLLLGRPQKARALCFADQGRAMGDEPALMDISMPNSAGLVKPHRLPASTWLRFLLEAATGNYDAADAALGQLLETLRDDAGEIHGLRADLHVLGGLLALERGAPALARHHFDQSSSAGGVVNFGGRALSTVMRKRLHRDGP